MANMMHDEFEPLRQMESFTEDMFNRIIAFQEKQHPAWNESLSFDDRIKNLPLHYLVFSSADRDPYQYAATIAAYYPLHSEMQKLAYYINQISSNAKVCDLYCGNGFIGSLLAKEGVKVTGLRAYNKKPNQIGSFFDSHNYDFSNASLEDYQCERSSTAPFDVVFASWMPSGVNPTPAIVAASPKLIIYVYTDHLNEQTGERHTGTEDMFASLPTTYQLIDEWSVTRPENLFHDIWPDLTPNFEETRITRIYASEAYHKLRLADSLPQTTPYDWEKELNMALLALKAKQEIRARGFPIDL